MHNNCDKNACWGFKSGFILASTSPIRRALLEKVRLFPDEIVAPSVNEQPFKNELPLRYVSRIAALKAQAVADTHPNTCILAADTILSVGRRIIRKSATIEDAREKLILLSSQKHRVITSICIIDKTGKMHQRTRTTVVSLKRLDNRDIDLILSTNDWQNVAGYKMEGLLSGFTRQIIGSYDNVLGLPTYDVLQILKGILR